MPTPDLPVELWLDILEYLPRSALRKLIGINRTLFELALNDIYEEVRFISDDKDMLKTFKQLRHENISRRVRHLFIRPAFLPGEDEDPPSSASLKHKFTSRLTYLKNTAKNRFLASSTTANEPESASPDELADTTYEVLSTARRAIKSCPNLRTITITCTITITVHDHSLTPLFLAFLDSLWKSDSIGPNLRKITLDTTASKIPVFIKPLVKSSSTLTNLREFSLNLSTSRFVHNSDQWFAASSSLVSLFTAFKDTFTSLSFSSMVPADLSEIFDRLPRLPKLTDLEILAVLNSQTFPSSEPLTRFIAKHSPTLQTLTIKPHARHVSFHHSDDAYTTWLNHEEAPALGSGDNTNNNKQKKLLYSFTQLELPRLRSLDIGLRELNRYRMYPSASGGRTLLPCLARIAPVLTRLVITDIQITERQLGDTIRSLTPSSSTPGSSSSTNPKPVLEELTFACYTLSPYVFDLLAQSLPKLKRLTIEYGSLAANTKELESHYDADRSTTNIRFVDAMNARRYTKWGLTYLRLVKPSSCGYGHPCIADMKIVAQSFPGSAIGKGKNGGGVGGGEELGREGYADLVLGMEAAKECQCTTFSSY